MKSNYCEAEAIAAKEKAERTLAELVETLKVDLITAAARVNDYAEAKDISRNHVNYGIVINCEKTLRLLGQEVESPCYGDGDYLKIPSLTINGTKTTYHNG